MKIAKKVLAFVMAAAMVFALSAMAFASETTFVLSSGNSDGVYTVTLSAKNAEGLETVDGIIKYDADVLEINGAVSTGEFAKAYSEIGESVMPLYNTNEAGKIDVGIAVAKKILPDTEFKKLAEENEVTANVTTANMALCTVKFKVVDSTAKSTTVTYTDNDTGATIKTEIKFNASSDNKGVTPPTAADNKAEAATEAATKAASNAAANNDSAAATDSATPISSGTSSSGNKSTGDNMALAIAAGVVVLAGAAFVFTKKRK